MDSERKPPFLTEFSKENMSEERDETAREILERRAEYFDKKEKSESQVAKLEAGIKEGSDEINKRQEEIDELCDDLYEMSDSGLGKMLNYFKIKAVKAEIEAIEAGMDPKRMSLDELRQKAEIERGTLAPRKASLDRRSADILSDFNDKQERLWARADHSREDIERYFSEEHLESLSVDEYALLLKRFPKEMVTHVTRQGIRDHVGMHWHSAGAGSYFDGFKKMTEEGRLHSPLSVQLLEADKEKAIQKMLRLDSIETEEKALKELDSMVYNRDKNGEPGGYADKSAVHFAIEQVADFFYGSEHRNEIFVAYPFAHVASQYDFSRQLDEQGDYGGYWNDLWVWAKEDKGMSLDAGLVFVPEDAQVDSITGSRYELDAEKKPTPNEKLIVSVQNLLMSEDFLQMAKVCDEAAEKTWPNDWTEIFRTDASKDVFRSQSPEIYKKLEDMMDRLGRDFGIKDMPLITCLLGSKIVSRTTSELRSMKSQGKPLEEKQARSTAENALTEAGLAYVLAKAPISSKDFWEAYFKKDPGSAPNKIVYYKGGDPTAALLEWQEKNGIKKTFTDPTHGFTEKLTPWPKFPRDPGRAGEIQIIGPKGHPGLLFREGGRHCPCFRGPSCLNLS